jgi:hypothetical protein
VAADRAVHCARARLGEPLGSSYGTEPPVRTLVQVASHCRDSSMKSHSVYLLSVLGAACAALCFAVSLAAPTSIVGPKPESSLEPRIVDTVNRASKGDRMRVIVRPPDAAPFEVQVPPGSSPKSPDGCESAFGWQDRSSAPRLAQSCAT